MKQSGNIAKIIICMLMLMLPVPFFLLAAQEQKEKTSGITLNDTQKTMFREFVKRLQDHPGFDHSASTAELPEWSYSGPEDPALQQLVKQHNLKKVAGNGPEIQQMLNLMEWVHRLLSRDGEIGNPAVLNTPAIIEFVNNGDRSVNCRIKAIVLNEALLSLGFKSRRISFLPSVFDSDSHAIVTVFCEAKQKWICMDPTFNTYFFNDNGDILGYLEIRDKYKSGEIPRFRHITIIPEWALMLNGKPFETYDAWYSVYMAKNCFRAACPLKSEFDYESSDSWERFYLSPTGYRPEDMGQPLKFFTGNAKYFFKKPE